MKNFKTLPLFVSGLLAVAGAWANGDKDTDAKQEQSQAKTLYQEQKAGKSFKRDKEITKMVRDQLKQDTSITTPAENIRVVTVGGIATLRGTANTDADKDKIVSLARNSANGGTINDELKVKAR